MIITHRRINNVLTLLVVLVAAYILVTPYIRSITWGLKDKSNAAPYRGDLRGEASVSEEALPTPEVNRIVIPSALIDLEIKEGNGLWVVDSGGSWRKNLHVQSPKEVGNTVIVAHRFGYTQPDDGFYHLDKVKVGDRLAIYWEGEELIYVVTETKTVPETAVEIERNSNERILTLYTCTPVLTAENRLVVIAKPEVRS